MHDLVSDLAKSVSGELCLRIEGDKVQDIPERTRHIWWSVELEDGNEILERIYKIKGVRSLMLMPKGYVPAEFQCFKICNNVQHDLFSRLKYLRMLSFCGCNLSELFVGISNLKLLRYLDLTETGIKGLPDSVCILHNLQTLILECCPLAELPLDLYKLISLHHLNLNGTRIIKMPKQIGRLVHLQVLPRFVVGEHSGSDIKELAELNHLQGTLWIEGLKNVIYPADAVEANLKDKKYLEELRMLYGYNSEINGSMIEMHVLEALQPNSNLIRLTIQDYRGTSFPKWLGYHHLPNLVSLNLSDCKFCSYLPPLGQLPSLKMLSIRSCDGIQFTGPEFYGNNSSNVPFRSLEILEFEYMPDLKEWLCFEGFPSLKKLHISCCPKF